MTHTNSDTGKHKRPKRKKTNKTQPKLTRKKPKYKYTQPKYAACAVVHKQNHKLNQANEDQLQMWNAPHETEMQATSYTTKSQPARTKIRKSATADITKTDTIVEPQATTQNRKI